MAFSFHKSFLSGQYHAAAESLLGSRAKALPEGYGASLVGALSFLGRMDEAETSFRLLAQRFPGSPAVLAARFLLGVGWTRKSEYARARKYFARNQKEAGPSAFERFLVHQGNAFYAYYAGRVREAERHSARARDAALRSENLWARALATDAYGHCRVQGGEIHLGLELLREAAALARRLGNQSFASAIAASLELYAAEFGLEGAKCLPALETRFRAVGTEDNYSLANVGLELARQYTRAGRYAEAAATLEAVAPPIYANQNRRQEILLNLRLAELATRRGDAFGARHYLRFVHRLRHGEVDTSFEIAALGLERKLALAEGKRDEAARLTLRWDELARDFAQTRDDHLRVRLGLLPAEKENREDAVHCLLAASQSAPTLSGKIRPLLEAGYLAAAAEALGFRPGRPGLAVLPQTLGVLVQNERGLSWMSAPLSSLQAKILRFLAAGDSDKERLVQFVWGYRYHPIRHDSMVYSALSSLRKALGAGGDFVQATDAGYRLAAEVIWTQEVEAPKAAAAPLPALPAPHLLSLLNHRQIEILEWMRERRFLAVGECRDRFAVSEVTALRDLDGLRRQGLVVRSGKARATRYALKEIGAAP